MGWDYTTTMDRAGGGVLGTAGRGWDAGVLLRAVAVAAEADGQPGLGCLAIGYAIQKETADQD
jgi:hypothetical protein